MSERTCKKGLGDGGWSPGGIGKGRKKGKDLDCGRPGCELLDHFVLEILDEDHSRPVEYSESIASDKHGPHAKTLGFWNKVAPMKGEGKGQYAAGFGILVGAGVFGDLVQFVRTSVHIRVDEKAVLVT